MKSRVVIKSSKSGMSIILDPDCTFEDLLSDLAAKFRENARFWGSVQMALILEGRELTAGEEFQIVNTITENSSVEILCLIDNDAQRIERCEKALNQKLMELSYRTGQFYRGDLHRGICRLTQRQVLSLSVMFSMVHEWLPAAILLYWVL